MTIGRAIIYFLLYVVLQGAFTAAGMFLFPNAATGVGWEWLQLCYSLVLSIALVFVVRGSQIQFHTWFVGPRNSGSLAWLTIAAVGIILAGDPIGHIQFFYRMTPSDLMPQGVALPKVLALCLFFPLAEEMFFRGLLFRGLIKRYSLIPSMIILALLFAAIHRLAWATSLDHILFSLVVTGIYYVTGSLLQVVVLHAIVNLVWVVRATHSVTIRALLEGLGWWYMILPVVGALLLLIYFKRFHERSSAFEQTALRPT